MVVSRKISSTNMRKPIRPIERQKMRPWLMNLLLHENVTGLSWLSKRDRTFRISWRHAARQGWNPDKDADLFEKWARHTGKHMDNDDPDPKRWKANFRCALNSLPDVAEVKDQGVRRGQNAFKVYRFLEEKKSKFSRPVEEIEVTTKASTRVSTRPQRTRIPNRKYTFSDSESEADSIDFIDDSSSSGVASPVSDRSDSGDETTCSASDAESLPETRPETEHRDFPHFDKICPDYHIEIDPMKSRLQTQHSTDDSASTTSSTLTDEEVVEMLLLEDIIQPDQIAYNESLWTTGIVPDIAMEQDVETTYTILQNSSPSLMEYQVVSETTAVRTEQIPIGIQQETVYTSILDL
ncbi:interferon regulatory factor 2-like [Mizuhopecten yessoensis]|uniref:interferon regulatory factor 2-like n=1 Tax=Mizuhopecten yessoensis TaxID=6573 RepID=UPI000B457537|nr:interferon regulatory factor 2-like [Mizuhopecten yessoensis]